MSESIKKEKPVENPPKQQPTKATSKPIKVGDSADGLKNNKNN